MGKIIILDEYTSNKIAAGEVIERPASVVKELVENSIDAGAGSISIEIKNGGVSYIKVSDNGTGFDEDDVEIAFERHSTSKIKLPSDLDTISTFGFRGEALASITAVSKIQLTTRNQSLPYGIFLEIHGGDILEYRQKGCPAGTTFIVRDLFYNTPARYKFLKRDSTEAGYVSDIVGRIALGNPQISFRLISNGKNIIHTPGNNDLLSVIFSIYGKEIARNVKKINYQDDFVKIEGYAGNPEIARSNRNCQSIFVNNRYVKSKIISSAIDEAYRTMLMKNRHAFVVLKLEINPVLVDVNVHPAKMEVRFSNEQDIYKSILHALSNTLLNKTHEHLENVYEKSHVGIPETKTAGKTINTGYEQQRMDVSEHIYDIISKLDIENETNKPSVIREGIKKDVFSDVKIVGQAFLTYVILEKDDHLILLDQHAVHERVKYEELKRKFDSNESLSQVLLIPVVVELTHQEADFVENEKILFSKLGFTYENFGNNSIIIRGIPFEGTDEEIKATFLKVIDMLMNRGKTNFNLIADETLYTIACKAAVKANKALEDIEIKNMLKELSMLENPYSCPHGRPVAIEIGRHELERMFKRIV